MPSLKRATKACLRPLYRGLVKPLCRPLLRRLREFLTPIGVPATLESVQRDVWEAHAQLQALVGHIAQMYHTARDFGVRLGHLEGALHETDGLLLGLIKAAPAPRDEAAGGHGRPFSAVYLGGGRLLADHALWPFLYLDADDPLVTPRALTHTYEVGVRRALERLVRPGDTVVEVGAGQGYHTLTLAALTAPGGHVVAFEPNPRAVGFLRQTLLCNGLEHVVRLRPEAAYNETRTLPLYLGVRGGASGASLFPPAAGGPAVDVDAVRVGDVLDAERLRPNLIRLDVAGTEVSALEGMGSCLESVRDVKVMFPIAAGGRAPGELLGRLADRGFKFWSAGEDGMCVPVGVEELLDGRAGGGGEIVAARELEV